MTSDPFFTISHLYDHLFGPGEPTDKKRAACVLTGLETSFKNVSNAVVADIGGGTGLIAFELCKSVQRIYLIDPSDAMLQEARNKIRLLESQNVTIQSGSFENTGLKDNSVDIVISINGPFQALLDLESQKRALNEIYRILRPGGMLLFDIMNFFSIIDNYRLPKVSTTTYKGYNITRMIDHTMNQTEDQWIHTEHLLVENCSTGSLQKIVSTHRQKMTSKNEVRLLLEKAGFERIKITGHPEQDPTSSTRTWIYAFKPI